MGQRREIAARAHRAFLGNHRRDSVFEHGDQRFDHSRTAAAVTLREHVRAQHQHCTSFGLRKWRTESARVTADEVELQFAELGWFDANVRELTEARIDAVNGAAFGDDLFND